MGRELGLAGVGTAVCPSSLAAPAEIGALPSSPVRGPGTATFIFETLTQLHAALARAP